MKGGSSATLQCLSRSSLEVSRVSPLEWRAFVHRRRDERVCECISVVNYIKVAEDKEKSPIRGEEVKMPPATVSEATSSSPAAATTTPASQAAAAAFLAWPPLLLHPWAPALLPGAWCSSAIRSALPGLVTSF